jgi:hypothetical protein
VLTLYDAVHRRRSNPSSPMDWTIRLGIYVAVAAFVFVTVVVFFLILIGLGVVCISFGVSQYCHLRRRTSAASSLIGPYRPAESNWQELVDVDISDGSPRHVIEGENGVRESGDWWQERSQRFSDFHNFTPANSTHSYLS